MCRRLPSHAQFRGTNIEIINLLELDEQLLHLAQIILYPAELKLVTYGKTIKSNSKIFMYSSFSFLGAAGFLRSTGFIGV